MKKIINLKEILILMLILIIAFVGLLGWSTGELLFAKFSVLYIPMAPSTAISFVFLILSLFFALRFNDKKNAKLFSEVFVISIILLSSYILARFLFGFSWDLENIFLKKPGTFGKVTIGRMSPLTAGLFILYGIAILLLISIPKKSSSKEKIYSVIVVLSLFVSTILLIGYLYSAPLLYDLYVIPVALPTAICFWLLGIVLFSCMEFNFLFFINSISSVEKKLTKTLIPLTLLIVIIYRYIDVVFHTNFENPAILSALLLIIIIPVIVFIIYFISKSLGKSIYQVEQVKNESENRLKDLFRHMNEGFALHEIIMDDNGKPIDYKYLEVNPAFSKITGIEKDKVIGKKVRDIFPGIENDPAKWIEKYGDVALYGKELTFEEYSQTVGRWFVAHAFCPKKGQFAVTFSDITNRKKADLELKESEERFRRMFSNAFVGTVINRLIKDEQGNAVDFEHLDANSAIKKHLGADPAQIIGTLASQLVSPEQTHFMVKLNEKVVKTGIPYHIEKHFEAFGKTLELSAFHLEDDTFVSTFIDITDRKLAEEEVIHLNENLEKKVVNRTIELENKSKDLNESQKALLNIVEDLNEQSFLLEESTKKLENANKELQAFTYSVSHDLKAPLRGIDGYSKLLLEIFPKDLNEEAKTFLNNIRSGTLQMNQLIEDLLAYSRLERTTIRDTEIDVKKIIDNIVSNYKEEIETRKIKMIIDIKKVFILTDYNGLSMVLRNLIENAIKFTKPVPIPVISINLMQSESNWEISVKDNGIGFKMEYHDKIFEIFQRLHPVEDYPGTGIGLALVKKAMKRMGGSISVVSKPNSGTTFFIKIPKKLNI